MLRKSVIAAATGIVILLGAGVAQAVPITFYFTGVIDYVEDLGGVWGGQLPAGSVFSGSYVFDSEAEFVPGGDPNTGFYEFASMTLVAAGNTIVAAGDQGNRLINLANLAGTDSYSVYAQSFQSGGFDIAEMGLGLVDWTGQALLDTNLPLTPPVLSLFQRRSFGVSGWDDQRLHYFTARGTITSLFPEPGSALSLLLLTGLGSRRRLRAEYACG